MPNTPVKTPRQRVPASERREALIEAAVSEFAHGGLHGTPVERIARRVGVAQPYVFSLFSNKRELFLAAVEHDFDLIRNVFEGAAAEFDPDTAEPGTDVLNAMGSAYVQMLGTHRDYLLLQHQAYAACDDEVIRQQVRRLYARLVVDIERLSDAEPERIDDFLRNGMWLNVAAAMGVEDLSSGCDWIQAALAGAEVESGPGR